MSRAAISPAPPAKRWLSRREAAEYLSMSAHTLANMACKGTGPKFRNPSGTGRGGGNALYDVADLDKWVLTHGSQS